MSPLRLISRHGTKIIAGAALVGLAVPELAAVLRPYLGVCLVTMLCVSMLRVDTAAFVARMRRPRLALAAGAAITVACPLVVLGAAAAIGPPVGSAVGLAVIFLFVAPPPIVSAPAFAMLMGLDGALVLAVMLCATLAMPFTVPAIAALFVGETLPVGGSALAVRLALIIGGAFFAAAVIRRAAGPERIVAARPLLDTVSVTISVGFAIAAMDSVAARFTTDPAGTSLAALAAIAAQTGQIAVFYLAFRPFVGVDAVPIAYAAGNRNAGLVVAALGATAVNDTVWLFFALSQLPVFMFPLVLSPLGRRLSMAPATAALSSSAAGSPPGAPAPYRAGGEP